jgi:hypothetical protein
MGIGWTLQGIDAVSSATDAAVSISVRVVVEPDFDSDRASDRFSEVCGADPRHTWAKG